MKLKREFSRFDAEERFADNLKTIISTEFNEPAGCGCDRVLRGLMEPQECALFSKACTPQHPVGPCMVSTEGSCHIEYRYRRLNLTQNP